MDQALLLAAQKLLRLCGISLVSLQSNCGEFEGDETEIKVVRQHRFGVESSKIKTPVDDGGLSYLTVSVKLAVRWGVHSVSPVEEGPKFIQLGIIEGVYEATYSFTQSIEDVALDAFSLHNAPHHVWPYWRELVSNMCYRMDVDPIVLPMIKLADNREDAIRMIEE